jgi:23S rRNA (guanine745-N1)-methyltransferase
VTRTTIFVCPHCGQALHESESSAQCSEGHTFDYAKEGYLNLLVAGRLPSSATPGDTPDSLQARRRFLSGGWYQPISIEVSALLLNIDGPVLDVGCGEGYYLSYIDSDRTYGIDISKKAIQMASKAYPASQFAVASSYRLPVGTASCAGVFTVFAPHSFSEYQRVLIPGGTWVTVTPGPHHLKEMRPSRDETVDEREQRRSEPPEQAAQSERIQYTLDLTQEAAVDLFSMTPLRWQTAAHARPVTEVSVDVWIASGTNLM